MISHEKVGAVQVLRVKATLDLQQILEVKTACESLFNKGQTRWVLDLEEVPLIDSAGLEWILELHDRCAPRGGSMVLASPNRLCQDILRASGVSEQVCVYESVSSAIRSFA